MIWKAPRQQRLWAAVARAVRTPSLVDRGFRLELAPVPLPNGLELVSGAAGNPDLDAERLLNVEGGYRVSLGGRVSLDAVAFRGRYDDVVLQEAPTQPVMQIVNGRPVLYALATYENGHRLHTTGGEIAARVRLASFWDADASVSLFRGTAVLEPSHPVHATLLRDDTAARQWRLHSAFTLGARRVVDVRLFRVSPIPETLVPGYTRLDARAEWGLTRQLSLAVDGQNLLSKSHLESSMHGDQVASTRIPRSARLGLTWRF
jgi:iron complex outermembrane receptor protein